MRAAAAADDWGFGRPRPRRNMRAGAKSDAAKRPLRRLRIRTATTGRCEPGPRYWRSCAAGERGTRAFREPCGDSTWIDRVVAPVGGKKTGLVSGGPAARSAGPEACGGRDHERAVGNNYSAGRRLNRSAKCSAGTKTEAVAAAFAAMMRRMNKAEPEGDSATRRALPTVLGGAEKAAWRKAAASSRPAKADRTTKTRSWPRNWSRKCSPRSGRRIAGPRKRLFAAVRFSSCRIFWPRRKTVARECIWRGICRTCICPLFYPPSVVPATNSAGESNKKSSETTINNVIRRCLPLNNTRKNIAALNY